MFFFWPILCYLVIPSFTYYYSHCMFVFPIFVLLFCPIIHVFYNCSNIFFFVFCFLRIVLHDSIMSFMSTVTVFFLVSLFCVLFIHSSYIVDLFVLFSNCSTFHHILFGDIYPFFYLFFLYFSSSHNIMWQAWIFFVFYRICNIMTSYLRFVLFFFFVLLFCFFFCVICYDDTIFGI